MQTRPWLPYEDNFLPLLGPLVILLSVEYFFCLITSEEPCLRNIGVNVDIVQVNTHVPVTTDSDTCDLQGADAKNEVLPARARIQLN